MPLTVLKTHFDFDYVFGAAGNEIAWQETLSAWWINQKAWRFMQVKDALKCQAQFIYKTLFSYFSIVMRLFTLVTPLVSLASFSARVTSAGFLASPDKVTIPSTVSTEVYKALVER